MRKNTHTTPNPSLTLSIELKGNCARFSKQGEKTPQLTHSAQWQVNMQFVTSPLRCEILLKSQDL